MITIKILLLCGVVSVVGLCGCGDSTPAPSSHFVERAAPLPAPTMAGAAPTFKPSVADLAVGFRVARSLEVPFYNDNIRSFVFSTDGKTVAGVGRGWPPQNAVGATDDTLVFLYDTTSGTLIKRLWMPAEPQTFLGFTIRAKWSPDRKYFAAWGTEESDIPTSLGLWEVASGRFRALSDPQMSVTAASWTRDSRLLVARATSSAAVSHGAARKCEMVIYSESGEKVLETVDLGERSVLSIEDSPKGAPLLLVVAPFGNQRVDGDPTYQSSICRWNNEAMSAPLMEFPPGDFYFGAAFGQSKVGLCGIRQSALANKIALYTLTDLNQNLVVWQKEMAGRDFSQEVQFSPDEKQLWALALSVQGFFWLDTTNGALSPTRTEQFPFYSRDGKKMARLLPVPVRQPTGYPHLKGTKPHLQIAELLKR